MLNPLKKLTIPIITHTKPIIEKLIPSILNNFLFLRCLSFILFSLHSLFDIIIAYIFLFSNSTALFLFNHFQQKSNRNFRICKKSGSNDPDSQNVAFSMTVADTERGVSFSDNKSKPSKRPVSNVRQTSIRVFVRFPLSFRSLTQRRAAAMFTARVVNKSVFSSPNLPQSE